MCQYLAYILVLQSKPWRHLFDKKTVNILELQAGELLSKKTSETRMGSSCRLGPGRVQGQSSAVGVQVSKAPLSENDYYHFRDIFKDDFSDILGAFSGSPTKK